MSDEAADHILGGLVTHLKILNQLLRGLNLIPLKLVLLTHHKPLLD